LYDIKTKELTFVHNLTRKSIFEYSAIEIVDWKIITIRIYRPPSSSRECFLQLLKETLNNIQKERHFLVLCGDWNINVLVENDYQRTL
jgi:exonuclease III